MYKKKIGNFSYFFFFVDFNALRQHLGLFLSLGPAQSWWSPPSARAGFDCGKCFWSTRAFCLGNFNRWKWSNSHSVAWYYSPLCYNTCFIY